MKKYLPVLAVVLAGCTTGQTLPATDIGQTTATLNGTATSHPSSEFGAWYYEFSADGGETWMTGPKHLYGGSENGCTQDSEPLAVTPSESIANLEPNTHYVYRLVADLCGGGEKVWTDSEGIALGTDYSGFDTLPANVLKADPMANPDPIPLWRSIDAENASRHQWFPSGGPGNLPYRRMTVFDGDDYYGERAELGHNEWRNGDTFMFFREGEHKITDYWLRLPTNFPLAVQTWQVVTQFKQTQPSVGGGGPPRLELDAYGGRWRIRSDLAPDAGYWSSPARVGVWTHFRWDVVWSQDPAKGRVQLTIDDGTVSTSPVLAVQTLVREESPGGKGIAVGASIPAHLRIGLYHDPSISCPDGCSVECADVEVLAG